MHVLASPVNMLALAQPCLLPWPQVLSSKDALEFCDKVEGRIKEELQKKMGDLKGDIANDAANRSFVQTYPPTLRQRGN